MLTGTELLNAIAALEAEGKTRTEQCRACGYEIDGRLHFTAFYEAIMAARGITTAAVEREQLLEKYPDNQETINELLDNYDADAIKAFIEYFGEEYVEHFEESYMGEYGSGADFAEQLVSDCYTLNNPAFVVIDWEATWDNLSYDYAEWGGYIFSLNW